jgi:hypothetical protein
MESHHHFVDHPAKGDGCVGHFLVGPSVEEGLEKGSIREWKGDGCTFYTSIFRPLFLFLFVSVKAVFSVVYGFCGSGNIHFLTLSVPRERFFFLSLQQKS